MIDIKNVSYQIADSKILNGINLELPKVGVSAIIGCNGAGKSFLLSIVARLLDLQTGSIHIDDLNLSQSASAVIAKKLAILTQDNSIQARISVYDLLMFGRFPYHQGKPSALCKEIVETSLKEFDLQDYASRYLSELSGGQRQRAYIAMVFCQSTTYVLLDEPLNNLDIFHCRQLMQLLRQQAWQQQRSIVVVLHDINQACRYADHIIAMQNGSILFQGSPEEVITAENIYQLFNVDCDVIRHKGKLHVLV